MQSQVNDEGTQSAAVSNASHLSVMWPALATLTQRLCANARISKQSPPTTLSSMLPSNKCR